MKIIRFTDLVATPWKNGGGLTREIAAYPEGAGFDTFDWRVSIADVTGGGPFSRFENVDRTLVLIDGTGLRLTIDGDRVNLDHHGDHVNFAGEASVLSHLGRGMIRDFNVMTRRGIFLGLVEVRTGAAFHTDSTALGSDSELSINLLFLLEKQRVTSTMADLGLQRHDAIILEPDDFGLMHTGKALHVRISSARP